MKQPRGVLISGSQGVLVIAGTSPPGDARLARFGEAGPPAHAKVRSSRSPVGRHAAPSAAPAHDRIAFYCTMTASRSPRRFASALWLKSSTYPVDLLAMESSALPSKAGPVPDRIAIWPLDDGRYGLDATFQGATGYERAERHKGTLDASGVAYSFRQEIDGGWTLRFGPLSAAEVATALGAFVR